MLYLIATPIGNLEDLTYRAVKILNFCDYTLCEDTRKSIILFEKYNIKKPLFSFHKFNEYKEEEKILDDLKTEKNIAIISDAGTPLICDPGKNLIKRCIEENIAFTSIPGPCSIVNALVLSGMENNFFQFFGFFPKTEKEQIAMLRKAALFDGTTIFFEVPHRLIKTLKLLDSMEFKVSLCREMTKIHEECRRGTGQDLLKHFENREIKGEIVLLLEGGKKLEEQNISTPELITLLQENFSCSLKEAIKWAAKLKNTPKTKLSKEYFTSI